MALIKVSVYRDIRVNVQGISYRSEYLKQMKAPTDASVDYLATQLYTLSIQLFTPIIIMIDHDYCMLKTMPKVHNYKYGC